MLLKVRTLSYFWLSIEFFFTVIFLYVVKYLSIYWADDASRKPEDSDFMVDVLTRCAVNRDGVGKKIIKIIPLKEPGEPVVVSVSISQVSCMVLFFNPYWKFPCAVSLVL